MKDKFKEHACEFKNEDECEEELEADELNLEEEEKKHFDEESSLYRSSDIERDEKKFRELVQKGIDEGEAAHIVDREASKHLKDEEK